MSAERIEEKAKLKRYCANVLKAAGACAATFRNRMLLRGIPVDDQLDNAGFVDAPNDVMAFDFAECWTVQLRQRVPSQINLSLCGLEALPSAPSSTMRGSARTIEVADRHAGCFDAKILEVLKATAFRVRAELLHANTPKSIVFNLPPPDYDVEQHGEVNA
eukprot:2290468-Amphidinium_carterae.1